MRNGNVNCDELKDLLHGYVDGEIDLVRSLEIERHLEGCPGCAEALGQLKRLRQALQEPALYHRPGPGLRERIVSSLPQAQASTAPVRRHFRKAPPLAALLSTAASLAFAALAIWGIVYLRSNPGGDQTMRMVVAGHVRSLMMMPGSLVQVQSSDQHTVKPWFAKSGQLGFAPPVPNPPGYSLLGGRLEYLEDQKVAALVYKRREHIINLFIWPQSHVVEQALQKSTRQGYHLLHWSRGGFAFWAISDLNGAELQEFAELSMR
jgi:anti-sigma factor RsiW